MECNGKDYTPLIWINIFLTDVLFTSSNLTIYDNQRFNVIWYKYGASNSKE